jgi:hypothetical protein
MRSAAKLLCAGLLAVASLALSATPAFGALTHSEVQKTFEVACPGVTNPVDVAVHEATETVYVACNGKGRVLKYDYEGTPTNFSTPEPYIVGNAIIESQVDPEGIFGGNIQIAVDNSGGPADGNLYVSRDDFKGPEIYKPSGEYVGTVGNSFGGGTRSIDVGPDGYIYIGTSFFNPQISKWSPSGAELARIGLSLEFIAPGPSQLAADSTGAIWSNETGLHKFEVDQFNTHFAPGAQQVGAAEKKLLLGTYSPFVPQPLPEASSFAYGVDPTTNDLYTDSGSVIRVFSQGTSEEPAYQNAPSFGPLTNSNSVTVTPDHRVFATTENKKVVRFGPGDIVPDIHTHVADVDEVGHTSATVTGEVELAGGTSVSECVVQVGHSAGSYPLPPAPCSPASFSEDKEVSANLTGLEEGATYHYRIKATNAKGSNAGIDRTVTPAYVLKLKTLAATEIDQHDATLGGSFEPDLNTTYYFEYGVDESYGLETEPVVQGATPGIVVVGTELGSLPSGRTFHYRIVASNSSGTTIGPDMTFRTASTPDVAGLHATELSTTVATLNAKVNPVGYPTEYRFEYGTNPEYGQATPWVDIGSGNAPVDVQEKLEGLRENTTYHFRVVAKNEWGETESPDTTFNFAPPECPNNYVRQQTNSSYLPDCRAYELVSPGKAGGVLLYPGDEYWELEGLPLAQDEYGASTLWAQNTGLAMNPARFAFASATGTIEGLHAPNQVLPDTYVSTRTTSGWVTTLPGIDDTYGHPSRKQCSDSMAFCIEGSYPEGSFFPEELGNAPYLFNVDGDMLERLPTNLALIPNGAHYIGARRIASDFGHLFFSSRSVPFAAGGITTGPGSAYDNDLRERTVTLVSRLENGQPIPQFGSSTHAIEFPGVSADGTHVLMQTESSSLGPYRLYMRVNDAVTYELAPGGKPIKDFVGMTRDGGKVFFTSAEQLTGEDTDSGVDLYMWKDDGSLTLISQGNGNGNSDACSASWISQCGVGVLDTERRWAGYRWDQPGEPPYYDAKGFDDLIAEEAGDVYFYSPELLDGTKFGIKNQRNLYVDRKGAIQLVATLDAGTQIYRMQISRDGSHAALLTDSRLTSYDNEGFREMYTYDAETGAIRCASCAPNGDPPSTDVRGSEAGPYMADDGRTFFATSDDLVPRDKDNLTDVYEYVDGQPQLISSGVTARDFTGGSELFGVFVIPVHTGLESVSRDGTDVFFSTYDTLVEQDLNGQFIKFYDARIGGGFTSNPPLGPCAAADECHGPASSPPAPDVVTSGAALGSGGNVVATPKRKGHHRQHRRKHRRKKANRQARHGHG